MIKTAKELAFWVAVGLAGAATVGLLKTFAGRFNLPQGFEEAVAAL